MPVPDLGPALGRAHALMPTGTQDSAHSLGSREPVLEPHGQGRGQSVRPPAPRAACSQPGAASHQPGCAHSLPPPTWAQGGERRKGPPMDECLGPLHPHRSAICHPLLPPGRLLALQAPSTCLRQWGREGWPQSWNSKEQLPEPEAAKRGLHFSPCGPDSTPSGRELSCQRPRTWALPQVHSGARRAQEPQSSGSLETWPSPLSAEKRSGVLRAAQALLPPSSSCSQSPRPALLSLTAPPPPQGMEPEAPEEASDCSALLIKVPLGPYCSLRRVWPTGSVSGTKASKSHKGVLSPPFH